MNPRIIKLGVESGMLNYVDHETPRHYFLCAHADEECLERFAELIVRECCEVLEQTEDALDRQKWPTPRGSVKYIIDHFGDES
jgi:hypothetical protein